MLAQYLVSLGAKACENQRKSVKVVNSPQVKKETTFRVHLLVESFCIAFRKYILRQCLRPSFVLNLFLIFGQISRSCSCKIVLIRKECVSTSSVILKFSNHCFSIASQKENIATHAFLMESN